MPSSDAEWDIAKIRALLTAAFDDKGLRQFLEDRPAFRPVLPRLGSGYSRSDVVDAVIAYCEQHHIWQELLEAVCEKNPRQIVRFGYRSVPDRSGHDGNGGEEVPPRRPRRRLGVLFATGLVCGVVLAALVWGLFYLLTGSPLGGARPTLVPTPVAALASPAPTGTATGGAGKVLGDATQGPTATEAPPAAAPTDTELAAAPTGTSASPTGVPTAGGMEGTGTAAAGPGGPTATGTGAPPTLVIPTPGPTVQVPTVAVSEEGSVVRLTTGLGVKKELAYDGPEIGDYVLNQVMRQREEGLGQHQFVVALEGGVNMVMPLCVLRSAERTADGQRQTIVLADGTQMDGELLVLLEDANGESYDLGTAERLEVASLAREDECRASAGTPAEGLWQLEVGDPVNEVYTVMDPRFVLSSYTSRKFYLADDAGVKHLANLQDIDMLTVDTAGDALPKVARVRVGETETSGKITAVRDDLLVELNDWYLAGDRVDRDATVVVSNDAGPELTLRREGASPP